METTSEPTTEFYVPATFQFSSESGRIERVLVGIFDEGDEISVRRVAVDDPTPEFYVPAMIQFSIDPGRIERLLQALFEGDEEDLREVPAEFRDDFYLPAVDPDEYRWVDPQPPAPLMQASAIGGDEGNQDHEVK